MELGTSILSDTVIFLKYAKFLPRSKRRETWKQLVNRNREMHLKNFPDFQDEIKEAYKFVYDRKVLDADELTIGVDDRRGVAWSAHLAGASRMNVIDDGSLQPTIEIWGIRQLIGRRSALVQDGCARQ